MITFAIWAIIALLIWASYKICGRLHIGYFIGGLMFGVYNEVCFEFCWNYDARIWPFIYKDISLAVIIGWAVVAGFSASLVDYIMTRLWVRNPSLIRLVLDTVVFATLGITQEYIMHATNFWTYNFPMQGSWPIQLLGYTVPAVMMISTGRRIQDILERN